MHEKKDRKEFRALQTLLSHIFIKNSPRNFNDYDSIKVYFWKYLSMVYCLFFVNLKCLKSENESFESILNKLINEVPALRRRIQNQRE
jgi:hypothetical protein